MSTSGITSSLLSEIAASPSSANLFVTDLNQVAQDLKSGNISSAEQDYVTLSQDAQDGATASTADTSASGIPASLLSQIAGSPSSSAAFVGELNQLGTDLGNGNLDGSQEDLISLESTALNSASTVAGSSTAATGAASAAGHADATELIQTVIQAMEAGDSSAASSALSQLASVSTSSQGASYLQQLSDGLGGSSGSSSSSGSIGELLDSLNSGSSNTSPGLLDLIA
jgi:trimeric autotransporter adhesin